MTERQLACLKNNKMDINFVDMVKMNLKRDNLQGTPYCYRAIDLMWFNEQQNQLKEIQNETAALQNFFTYMEGLWKDGKLKAIGESDAVMHKTEDSPEVEILKRQLKEEKEAHARDTERLELQVTSLKEELRHYKDKLFELEKKVNK